MRRRDFIAALGSTVTWSLTAQAQQPTIGFLHSVSSGPFTNVLVAAFRQGLKETDYVEGQNVIVDHRWAEGQNNRLPELAADLVRQRVIVIAAAGGPSARAAKAATTTTPIVFWMEGDPVELGLVGSLNRPGGNLTGVTTLGAELTAKRLELLHELVPAAASIAVLVDPTTLTAEAVSRDVQSAASALGVQMHILHASVERDFDTAFASLVQLRVGGVVIGPGPFFTEWSKQLGAMAVRHGVPAIFQFREFVAAGGLLSYGGSVSELYDFAGVYTGRILKGEKPPDLPVQQSTKVELMINLKTARALGITVPQVLLGRADEVIE